jgi:hypothetical protein
MANRYNGCVATSSLLVGLPRTTSPVLAADSRRGKNLKRIRNELYLPESRIFKVHEKEASMDTSLTIAEIETRFESEWVLVEEPETNEALEVQAGRVTFHSKDRDEVYRKAIELRPKRFAMLYTGKMPENTAIVL